MSIGIRELILEVFSMLTKGILFERQLKIAKFKYKLLKQQLRLFVAQKHAGLGGTCSAPFAS